MIQAYFEGIGKIYHHDHISEATFRVGSLNELDVIIRHFLKHPLITQKYSDFILFKQVIDLIKNKEHLTLQGILKIANIKASMNTKQEIPDIPGIVPVLRASLPIDAHLNLNPY